MAIKKLWFEIKLAVESCFGLYKPTLRQYFTTYYFDIERVGRLSGEYEYRIYPFGAWVSGRHPKNKGAN